MNSSPEQIQIVRTVVNEFFEITANVPCAEKILQIVQKFAEGKTNTAITRCEVRDELSGIGKEFTDDRLNLCFKTALALSTGYLRWLQDQENTDELDIYPAVQLFDLYHHSERIDWLIKWKECGGQTFDRDEMIALKNDPVWTKISVFHLPFPPFDIDSGMDVDAIPRKEAEKLGLIKSNERVEPSVANLDFGTALREQLKEYFSLEAQESELKTDQAVNDAPLEPASPDGFALLRDALEELKACDGKIEREIGTKILDELTKAAEQLPEKFQRQHAEIYRATGEILEAWGDVAQAIEYYEFAIQKDATIGVKKRLDALRKITNRQSA
jgi:tetratricopeptide (TPR) repeat protein